MPGCFKTRFTHGVIGLVITLTWLLAATGTAAGQAGTNDTEATQWERIYERVEKRFEQRGITNTEKSIEGGLLRQFIVHPAFGIDWDEVPPPTLTNSSAMVAVNAFIATNGWNTYTGGFFGFFDKNTKSIRGLPWKEIRDRDFPALTHNGILYVMFRGFDYNANGVAYNPGTNAFPGWVRGFKPLKNHWYVWALPREPTTLPQVYEGSQKGGEPNGTTNPSQAVHPETNRTPAAGGSSH